MPFVKGQSGNRKGRPKQTQEQKHEKEQFIKLLKESTVTGARIKIVQIEMRKSKINKNMIR